MALRSGSLRLALCAMLMGTASAWGLAPHDRVRGPRQQQLVNEHAETAQNESVAHPDERGSADRPLVVKTITPEKSPQEAAQDAKEHKSKDRVERITILLSIVTAIFAAVQTGIFGLQALIFSRQAKSLRDTIKAMQDVGTKQSEDMQSSISAAKMQADSVESRSFMDQRPWLAIEIKVVGPLEWREGSGIYLPCIIEITNTGKSPATSVQLRNRASINNFVIDFTFFTNDDAGIAIFPGQKVEFNETFWFPKDIGPYNLDNAHVTMPDGTIIPYIVGCAFYKNRLRGEGWHQTGYVFIIRRSEMNGYLGIRREHGDIPPERISMRRWHDHGPTT